MTFSELIVTLLIWVLAGCGAFFGLRAKLRKKNNRNLAAKQDKV